MKNTVDVSYKFHRKDLNNNRYRLTGKPDLIKIEFLKIHSS